MNQLLTRLMRNYTQGSKNTRPRLLTWNPRPTVSRKLLKPRKRQQRRPARLQRRRLTILAERFRRRCGQIHFASFLLQLYGHTGVSQVAEVDQLKAKVKQYADYDEIKRELEIMKVGLRSLCQSRSLVNESGFQLEYQLDSRSLRLAGYLINSRRPSLIQ